MNFNEVLSMLLNSTEAQIIFRILLAVCFGALIGLEREHAHRPAGLRTHILVCVGACLVMLTSEFIYKQYHQFSPNTDVARLGAQVISGVGFLGAGTIIRNGSSVKGLTTAASIWVVACIGLATGMGFYFGATIATVTIFLCLAHIKKISGFYDNKKISLAVMAEPKAVQNVINTMEKSFTENLVRINKVSIKTQKNNSSEVHFQLSVNESVNPTSILNNIYSVAGVNSVSINSKKSIKEDEE